MTGSTGYPLTADSHSSGSPAGFAAVANDLETSITGDLTSSATTITVGSTAGFSAPGYICIDDEVISVTGTSGGTQFTGCTRGADGTTAVAHAAGSIVSSAPVAANHNDLAAAIAAIETDLLVTAKPPIIVNGNFDIWQRSDGSSVTSTTTFNVLTSFCADRIFVLPAGASVTQARSTTVPNTKSRYSLAVTGAASVTTVDIGQRIRAQVVNTRILQSLVFSAYVRNESGAAFSPTLRIGTPGAADDFTTVTNRLDTTLQSCADSAWTRVYYVFDPSAYTNIANGAEVVLRVPSGSLVSGDVVRVAQMDLRPGTALGAFIPPDPDTEYDHCLQYWETISASGANAQFGNGGAYSATIFASFVPLARKRTTPTFSSATAASDFKVLDGSGSGITVTGLSLTRANPNGFNLAGTVAAGLTAGQACPLLSVGTAAKIHVSAELV